ncbi:MAG: tetratricopeptide repeat protein [Fodinibius sp.]|nr:tetratricopeptide repeat protein [Fodinibius sp.]
MIESFNEKELEEKIDQYINGQLSAQEVDELWAELIQDGYHLDYLKSAANVKAVIERKRKERRRKKNKYWYYAAAAVVALLVGVFAVMNYSTQNTANTIQPISSVELDYYRSANGNLDANDKAGVISKAIELANTGRVNEAISLLETELDKASEPTWVAKLSLNLGSLYYNQTNYDKAIRYYRNVIENKEYVDVLMLEKAYWYVGNAYFHQDKLAEAETNIEQAYEINGAYRRVAESYLEALSE